MICPACYNRLRSTNFQTQNVDICLGCGGVWFDKGELGQVANSLIIADEIDSLTTKEAYRGKVVSCYKEQPPIRKCPKCKVDMKAFNYAFDSNIILDKCLKCNGIWTDRNEIIAVARHIKGSPIAKAYGEALMEVMGAGNKKERTTAAGISFFYLFMAFRFGEEGDLVRMLWALAVPLSSIFFSGIISTEKDIPGVIIPYINRKGVKHFLRIAGWILLFSLPLIFYLSPSLFGEK